MPGFSSRLRSPAGLAVAGVLTFIVGGAAGSAVTRSVAPIDVMAPGSPVPIAQLAQASQPWVGDPVVTVRGRVAETYGDRFVLADNSGRVLVELARRGDGQPSLAVNQEVTVQGRYDDDVIRARYLVGTDGRIAAFGGGGRHGGPRGPRGDRAGPDGPPPPAQQAPVPESAPAPAAPVEAPAGNQAG